MKTKELKADGLEENEPEVVVPKTKAPKTKEQKEKEDKARKNRELAAKALAEKRCKIREQNAQQLKVMQRRNTVRFGVVGTNFVTDWLIAGAGQDERFELVAVCSRRQETANAFAKKHGIPYTFTSVEEMAKSPLIDAVYIATPNYMHAEQSIICMTYGKHVLCEKPFASNAREVRKMIKAAKENEVTLMEAMKPTLTPNFRAIQENIARLGSIRGYFSSYCQYSSRFEEYDNTGVMTSAFDPKLSNGSIMDIGVYTIYPMVVLFGRPQKVDALAAILPSGADGQGAINLLYDGMNATLLYSKIANSSLPTEIQGDFGNILADRINRISEVSFIPRPVPTSGKNTVMVAEDISIPTDKDEYYYEVSEFISLVLEGRAESKINSLNNSLITIEVMDTVRRQIGLSFPCDSF